VTRIFMLADVKQKELICAWDLAIHTLLTCVSPTEGQMLESIRGPLTAPSTNLQQM
jgi:hypothetical protein